MERERETNGHYKQSKRVSAPRVKYFPGPTKQRFVSRFIPDIERLDRPGQRQSEREFIDCVETFRVLYAALDAASRHFSDCEVRALIATIVPKMVRLLAMHHNPATYVSENPPPDDSNEAALALVGLGPSTH